MSLAVTLKAVTAGSVHGGTDTPFAAGDSFAFQRPAHKTGQPRDEIRVGAHRARRGDNPARRSPRASVAIFDIQFHQGFGMFADKGDGRDDDALVVASGAPDFGIGGGADPLQRSDPALVADVGSRSEASRALTMAAADCSTCH